MIAPTNEPLDLMECIKVVQDRAGDAVRGDLSTASAMLASQALTLDTMFTEMARRAAINLGQYPEAVERYMRLALKTQSNCRATLETLAKLHQPREQTVRHVDVNDGRQAIVADHCHQHTGGSKNAESVEQSHATAADRQSAALRCQDAAGTACQSPAVNGRKRCRMHGGTTLVRLRAIAMRGSMAAFRLRYRRRNDTC